MRGHIRTRKRTDGKRYVIVYDVGFKAQPDGSLKRQQKWENVTPNTRKAAQKLLALRLGQLHSNDFIEPSSIPFSEFAARWVTKYARGQVKPGTLADYDSYFRIHLLPAFGGHALNRITTEDVHGFKAEKLSQGLSAQTVKHLLRVLRQMLQHAVEWRYLRENPAAKVKDPQIPKRDMDYLRPDEVQRFLDVLPHRQRVFFYVAIAAGLRRGELLAMKWSNIDWTSGRYFVRESLSRRKGDYDGGFTTPKTGPSKQSVDLSPHCLLLLRRHQQQQAAEKLQAGMDYDDRGLVFSTATGSPLDPNNVVKRHLHRGLEAAGLRRIRFHDLRHTCAALLINQGVTPKYIQRQLRHASIDTTFDTYGHLFPETAQAAVEGIDRMIGGIAPVAGQNAADAI